MSRPRKNIIDYFPHDCNPDMILDIIVGQYGNDGYVFFYRLRELLGRIDGHTYKCETQLELNYLLTQTVNNREKVESIICYVNLMQLIKKYGIMSNVFGGNPLLIYWMMYMISEKTINQQRIVSVP
jgi:hypothetical protein